MSIAFSKESLKLSQDLEVLTGENALLCYQCKRCTLGCPSAYAMRMKPHEMMRALQLGLKEEIYWSGVIWICISCETCNTRCPQKINILRVINGLRELALAKKVDYYNPYPAIPGFHRLFISLAARFGRMYELGLALLINLKMLTPFKDIDLAAAMLRKGRLRLIPHSSRGAKKLRQLMAQIRKLEQSDGRGEENPSPPFGK